MPFRQSATIYGAAQLGNHGARRCEYGGAFKITDGLSRNLEKNVINTPICESAVVQQEWDCPSMDIKQLSKCSLLISFRLVLTRCKFVG
jgi:hypothetical protein